MKKKFQQNAFASLSSFSLRLGLPAHTRRNTLTKIFIFISLSVFTNNSWTEIAFELLEMVLEVSTTSENQEYEFYPLNFGALHFSVKTSNDAHIALTATKENKSPKYEIFIGGWGNTKSSIRKNNEEPDKVIVDTPKILNSSEVKRFWIKWEDGFIEVGKQGEENPFMSWQDKESLDVSFFGVRTGWGATGVWTIEVTPGWNCDCPISGLGQWVNASNGHIPPNALSCGLDANNEQLYVARAEHNGALIPGKLVPSHGVVYVPWGGVENPKENYEVLCNCAGAWVKANNGEIPAGALDSGYTEDGEPLFIGRGSHDGSVTVGKVQPDHKACYVPYDGKEVPLNNYEVLVISYLNES